MLLISFTISSAIFPPIISLLEKITGNYSILGTQYRVI